MVLKRAGEHVGEGGGLGKGHAVESLAEAAGVAYAALRQRQVGEAGVPVGNGPCRLAVAGQVDGGQGFAHGAFLVVAVFGGSLRWHYRDRGGGGDMGGVLNAVRDGTALRRRDASGGEASPVLRTLSRDNL